MNAITSATAHAAAEATAAPATDDLTRVMQALASASVLSAEDFFPPEPAPPSAAPGTAMFDHAALERMKDDPYKAPLLNRLCKVANETYQEAVNDVYRMLMDNDKAAITMDAELDLPALVAASRRQESQARQYRELARMLVVGQLGNAGNPGWNPLDASTDKSNDDNVWLALLKMQMPEAEHAE